MDVSYHNVRSPVAPAFWTMGGVGTTVGIGLTDDIAYAIVKVYPATPDTDEVGESMVKREQMEILVDEKGRARYVERDVLFQMLLPGS